MGTRRGQVEAEGREEDGRRRSEGRVGTGRVERDETGRDEEHGDRTGQDAEASRDRTHGDGQRHEADTKPASGPKTDASGGPRKIHSGGCGLGTPDGRVSVSSVRTALRAVAEALPERSFGRRRRQAGDGDGRTRTTRGRDAEHAGMLRRRTSGGRCWRHVGGDFGRAPGTPWEAGARGPGVGLEGLVACAGHAHADTSYSAKTTAGTQHIGQNRKDPLTRNFGFSSPGA